MNEESSFDMSIANGEYNTITINVVRTVDGRGVILNNTIGAGASITNETVYQKLAYPGLWPMKYPRPNWAKVCIFIPSMCMRIKLKLTQK